MNLLLTDELAAVNTLLQTVGETPVNSLETTGLSDLSTARNILQEVSREVQSRGWDFNTDELTLTPDTDGYLNVPSDALKIDPVDITLKYVRRGTRLYDKANNTYVFTAPVLLEVVWFLAIEDLPEAARRYITIKAAKRFQNRILGEDAVYAYTKEDETEALALLMEEEIDSGDYNMGRDSYTTSMALRRY